MSLLRIRGSLVDAPERCLWALVNAGRDPVAGDGPLAELPQLAERVQFIIPAAQVLITRANLPPAARGRAGAVLAFAVEEETVGEPGSNHVSWLGSAGETAVLAVVDRQGLACWHAALGAAGIHAYEVHCETLLLPWVSGEWSLAWDGREGVVRSGECEGAATDCGDRQSPPLSLRLMLDAAQENQAPPRSIALYTTAPNVAPDIESWTRELGISVRLAGMWDWRTALPDAGVSLVRERQRWRVFTGAAARLRPAAWIVGAALAIHAAALVIDWTLLANEQRAVRRQMESRFRAVFPDAVAVVDPALQMRRQLAAARHAAGLADSGDLLPMLEQVAAGMKEMPASNVRVVSYEGGRITLELTATEEAALRRTVARLREAGLRVDTAATAPRSGSGTVVITVRSS
jgi:general secretion pathway protein L